MKSLALLFCVLSQCLSLPNDSYSFNEPENQIVLTSCVKHSALPILQVIVKAFNLTNLTSTGPVTCARFCDTETFHWDRFVLHIPAHGYFKDKLVCGCANKTHFRSAKPHPPSFCPQPCPQDWDKMQLPASSSPLRPMDQKQGILSLDGTDTPNNWTCGDGQEMLSVYKVTAFKESTSPSSTLTTLEDIPQDHEKDSSAITHPTFTSANFSNVKKPAWILWGLIFPLKWLIHD